MSNSVKQFRLNRRSFLRGTCATVSLPVLHCMLNGHGRAFANSGAPLPRRFGLFFFGNGVSASSWIPTETGDQWSLSATLTSLNEVKAYLNLLSGYEVKTGGTQLHHNGMAGILSGLPYIEISNTGGAFGSKMRGPTIDQLMVNGLNPPTNLSSLSLGVSRAMVEDEGSTLQSVSHADSETFHAPNFSPLSVYNALFEGFSPPEDPTRILRDHILDAVRGDIAALKNKIGTEDRIRLDAHLTAIDDLRSRIIALPPEYQGACFPMAGVTEENSSTGNAEPLTEVNEIMCDLWALAWACDLTRVTSMMFTGGKANTLFHQVAGVSSGHQDIITSNDTNAWSYLQPIQSFILSHAAMLLEKLKNTPEGDGNLLDNSLIMITSDCADAVMQTNSDYPVLLAGRCGGALRYPGIHHRHATVDGNTNDILVTLLLAMQSGLGSVGEGNSYSETPILDVLS